VKAFNYVPLLYPYSDSENRVEGDPASPAERGLLVSAHLSRGGQDLGFDQVRFLKGSLYEYRNVPLMEFEQLRNSPSVGSYISRNIRGKYPYDRIG
jgi:hypothetical protein